MPQAPQITVFHEAGKELRLFDYGTHFELMFEKVPILTSASLGTERAFGLIAGKYKNASSPRILIGGLGFGATLGAVLQISNAEARVIVVEKLETVISLATGKLSHLNSNVLRDPRVRLIRDDVGVVIERERGLDMILLDVDNGPEWASFKSNARLYGDRGLRSAARALRDGGTYAVWSGYAADAFLRSLRRAGFEPSIKRFYERGKFQARAYIGTKIGGCRVSRLGEIEKPRGTRLKSWD